MNTVTISVRGHSETRIAPEKGVVRFAINVEGSQRDEVTQRASRIAASVSSELDSRHVSWTSQTLSVWSDRPWSNDGTRLDPVHHATIAFTASSKDFDRLTQLIGNLGTRDEVQVHNVSWELTKETRERVEREMAVAAVAEATQRAAAYAAALELTSVEASEVADVGLLGAQGARESGVQMARLMSDAVPAVNLKPDEIQVAASVDMRFAAR